jgi:hypothetical protein
MTPLRGSDVASPLILPDQAGAQASKPVEIQPDKIGTPKEQAVELIRQEMNRLGKEVTASQIDWLLWNLGQDDRFRAKPYHRTVTTFY